MESVKTEETWNKKRIFIAVLILAILITAGYFFKTKILVSPLQEQREVKGTSTKKITPEPELKINVQEAMREKINNLKQEVLGLDVLEIASSSPQMQKILRDIKSLEQYPLNQAQEFCKKLCGL